VARRRRAVPAGCAAPRTCSAALQFEADLGRGWQAVGPPLDASVISDEGGRGEHGSFTGAFVGMLAFDTSGAARTADFDSFSYQPQ
jgi:xylan 1,4-beta-xylosidase